jgi:hypothetical protein
LIKVTIPFELVLYPTNILSATTITSAVGSANRDTIPSKLPTRQIVPPSAAFFAATFAAAFFAAATFAVALLAAALSDAALSEAASFVATLSDGALFGTAFIEEPLVFCSFF